MSWRQVFTAYWTLSRTETVRFLRIWKQTLLPSVMTMSLYYVIFGSFVGSRIQSVGEFSYIQFIVPGLVMMAVITNTFSNVASSFFGYKFQRSIEEILVSPMSNKVTIAGFVTGGVLRGLCVGALVLATSLFFTRLEVKSLAIVAAFIVLTSALFSLAGLLNAAYAKNFDDVSIVPTFVLTPLTYLGGVFYSLDALPVFWQKVSLLNPILYMVNGFRFGFLGVSDVSVSASLLMLAVMSVVLWQVNLWVFRYGSGLRN
jgi:ABC-2 type transport system permease protein